LVALIQTACHALAGADADGALGEEVEGRRHDRDPRVARASREEAHLAVDRAGARQPRGRVRRHPAAH
jgi:hypothetical protein